MASTQTQGRRGSSPAATPVRTAAKPTMRAVVSARYGPPEIAELQEIPVPDTGPRDILVRVHATTVNRTDCAYRAGAPRLARIVYGLTGPKATVLGSEFAGEVVQVGGEVQRFRVADRVFGYAEGKVSGGGHAEYISVAEDSPVASIPDSLPWDVAAAIPEGAHYALAMIRRAGIGQNTEVLVNGGTGGIGSAAVQICAHLGARVTAVCATPHVETVRKMGARRVIDYTAEDFTRDSSVTYDVVLDAVGKSTFGQCKAILRPRGLYFSSELGPWGQNPLFAMVAPLMSGKKVYFPIPTQDWEMMEYLRDLVSKGDYTPLIDRSFALSDIVEAYRYVEAGQKIGNVIVRVVEE